VKLSMSSAPLAVGAPQSWGLAVSIREMHHRRRARIVWGVVPAGSEHGSGAGDDGESSHVHQTGPHTRHQWSVRRISIPLDAAPLARRHPSPAAFRHFP